MSLFCAQWPVRARTDYIQYRVGPRSLHVCSLFTRIFALLSSRVGPNSPHATKRGTTFKCRIK